MTSRLRTWYGIWTVAVFGQQRGLVKGMTWLCGLTALLVGCVMMLVAKGNRLEAACAGAGFMLLLLSNTWWSYFMSGAAMQNSPANGNLVPSLNRQIRQVAAIAWVVTTALALPFAYGNNFSMAETMLMVLGLTSVGLVFAGRDGNLLTALLALLLYLLLKNSPLLQAWLSHAGVLAALGAVILAYVAISLIAAFPNGGERHWKQLSSQRAVLSWQDMKSWEEGVRRGGKRNVLYSWMLKRKCRAREPGAMLMLDGLGARNNALVTLAVVALLVAILLLARLVVELLAIPLGLLPRQISTGLLIGPVAGAVFSWTRFSAAIRSTPTEQTLLCLSPAMPAAGRLSAALAKRLTRICLAEWLGWSAGMLIVIAAWGAERSLLQGAVAVAAAMLMLTALPLENYAGKARGISADLVLAIVLMGALLIAALIMHDDFKTWLILVGVMLAISSSYLALRWIGMARGPIAFPSGRLA
ncbi:MAG: hypothetical protein V4723_13620 [Pseudomonadota bacterium]